MAVVVDAAPVVAEGELPAGLGVHVPEEMQLYIRKNVELVRHGYTEGCKGYNAARAGSAVRAHSAECRVRITSAMEGDETGLVRVTMDQLKKNKRKPEDEDSDAPPAVRRRDNTAAGAGASSSSARPAAIEENMDISELCANLSAMGEGVVHVSELFGPGRFTSRSSAFDLMPGTAMDFRTGFDFNMEHDRVRARAIIDEEKPWLIVGSPMCAAFSPLVALNLETDNVRQAMVQGVQHLFFVCEIYKTQLSSGRFFLHEHPKAATSWGLWMVKERSWTWRA